MGTKGIQMTPERFAALVANPARSRSEIEQMMMNAITARETDLARIAKEELDRRFPGWNKPRRAKASRARPTDSMFRGKTKHFPTAKDAYIWLIERFVSASPAVFQNITFDTVFIAKGKQCNYFARSVQKLFHHSPRLAEDHNNYVKLSNGWYANTNLNNRQKFEILCRFAGVAKLEHEKDWNWTVEDPTEELLSSMQRNELAKRIWHELDVELGHHY